MSKSDKIRHIGFIVDGNRRWAEERRLPKLVGHKKGYENVKKISEECFDMGIGTVSMYIFSTENWNREKAEVDYLMNLALDIFTKDVDELMEKDIKVVVSGSREKLSQKLLDAIDNATTRTAENKKGTINLCFNYGGQTEITDAIKSIVASGVAIDEIDSKSIRSHLYHPELPPVDLIIRTSGEKRLSNFLLWDSAYAELDFVNINWPAFGPDELKASIDNYNQRMRRYGR